ncbi:MAG: hypothetical protein IIC40_09225 [Candidatus Marinimicrobia bacterium]|nr:hypothetical protein [Candidatus Neomarinimicrobiota bacterium]
MKIDTILGKLWVMAGILLLNISSVFGQNTIMVTELVSPDAIVIFYVGDFNFTNASANPLIFKYRLSARTYPAKMKIVFGMTATVPSLNLNNEEIFFVETDSFKIVRPVIISNREIDESTSTITDVTGEDVTFNVIETRQLEGALQDKLVKSVTQSGKLPAGKYILFFKVTSSSADVDNNFEDKIIDITNPTTLDLVGPGGFLSEEFEIFTLFPIFQWESQGCEYAIRVSQYDPLIHSSVEEALNDISNLPFPDDGSYFAGDDGEGLESTTLQYPLSGAKQLEYGKTYVWSVKKTCITTAGEEERNSDIYAFKIANITGGGDDSGAGITGGVITDPVIAALQTIFGDVFEAIFSGDGELAGYTIVSNILLNDETATAGAVSDLAEKMLSGEVGPVQIEIQ